MRPCRLARPGCLEHQAAWTRRRSDRRATDPGVRSRAGDRQPQDSGWLKYALSAEAMIDVYVSPLYLAVVTGRSLLRPMMQETSVLVSSSYSGSWRPQELVAAPKPN